MLKADDILDGVWNSAFYKGGMIGVPGIECFFNWWGLNVNTNTEAEGLDATTLPKTWDEAMEWHKAMTKKDDAGNLLQFGLDPYDAIANEPTWPAPTASNGSTKSSRQVRSCQPAHGRRSRHLR